MELERSSSCTVASSSSWTASAWEQRRERNPPTSFSESSQRSCQKITIFDPHLRSINAKLGSDPLGLTSTFKDEEVDAPHRKRTCLIPGNSSLPGPGWIDLVPRTVAELYMCTENWAKWQGKAYYCAGILKQLFHGKNEKNVEEARVPGRKRKHSM